MDLTETVKSAMAAETLSLQQASEHAVLLQALRLLTHVEISVGASLNYDKFYLLVQLLLSILSLFLYSNALNFARACN